MVTCKAFRPARRRAQWWHLLLLSPGSLHSSLTGIYAAPANSKHIPAVHELSPGGKAPPPGICTPYSHIFIKPLLTCHLAVRHSLVTLAKSILPWHFLFPFPTLFLSLFLSPSSIVNFTYYFYILLTTLAYFLSLLHRMQAPQGERVLSTFFTVISQVPRTASGP